MRQLKCRQQSIDLAKAAMTGLILVIMVIAMVNALARHTAHLGLVGPCCDPGLSPASRSSFNTPDLTTTPTPTPATGRKHGGVGHPLQDRS